MQLLTSRHVDRAVNEREVELSLYRFSMSVKSNFPSVGSINSQ